jgi:hypothetical protein
LAVGISIGPQALFFLIKTKSLPITEIGADAVYGVEVARLVNRLSFGTGEPKFSVQTDQDSKRMDERIVEPSLNCL